MLTEISFNLIIRWRAKAREGDYNMHHVGACVSVSCRFPPKLLQLEIFCQLIVPMNFHALENFFGFVDLCLKGKRVIAILATLSNFLSVFNPPCIS